MAQVYVTLKAYQNLLIWYNGLDLVMLENLDGIMVIGLDKIKKRANEKGITILEALV